MLLCMAFTAVHSLYWSNIRMRSPLMPYLCLLAAFGSTRIMTGLGEGKWRFSRWLRCSLRR